MCRLLFFLKLFKKQNPTKEDKQFKKQNPMGEDEKCLDCEEYIEKTDIEGGGSPLESYYEMGFHMCKKKKPRVVKVKK